MTQNQTLVVGTLDPVSFSAYGHVLGGPYPAGHAQRPSFSNEATDFWQAHVFDAGRGGESEILWVNYRSRELSIESLEVHMLTEQAIVPLTGSIIHIVAASDASGGPDLSSIAAFHVPVGLGVCMRPGCWHATRVVAGEVTCLMLTRRSTTADLVAHLTAGHAAAESRIESVPAHVLTLS